MQINESKDCALNAATETAHIAPSSCAEARPPVFEIGVHRPGTDFKAWPASDQPKAAVHAGG